MKIGIFDEKTLSVKRNNYELALRRVYELLKEADSVTEESEDWEVKGAFSKLREVQGAVNNMVFLGILEPFEHETISCKQNILGEKVTKLNEAFAKRREEKC